MLYLKYYLEAAHLKDYFVDLTGEFVTESNNTELLDMLGIINECSRFSVNYTPSFNHLIVYNKDSGKFSRVQIKQRGLDDVLILFMQIESLSNNKAHIHVRYK